MTFLEKIRDAIKEWETRDALLYLGAFLTGLVILFGLTIYLHYRKVSYYQTALKSVENMRNQTKKIISDFKAVTAQKEKVEEILAQNKNFRVGEAYQLILEKTGLISRQTDQSTPTSGETTSGKTEIFVTSHLAGINMKQLTDLLVDIAEIPQMYVKDLVIKKNPTSPAVDIDITVATLEPSAVT